MEVMSAEYYFDNLADLERDIYDAINEAPIDQDEHGVFDGHFKIKITYEE